MAVKMTQNLKQSQTLSMTPQLQQAIKLLTLTHLEMTNVIAEEMAQNPMIEESGQGTDEMREEDYKLEKLERDTAEASSESFDEKSVVEKDDFDWGKYLEATEASAPAPSMVKADPDDIPNYESMVSGPKGLADHLLWQLGMENLTEDEIILAEHIVHNINDDGHLEVEFDEILGHTQLHPEDALEILKMVQALDPVGCGCHSMTDSLLVQARALEERSPVLELLIRDYLPLLQERNYEALSSSMGVGEEQIKQAELILQSLNPRPGRLISGEETHYVVPDIYVIQTGGKFVVQVNDEGVPQLRVSKLYQDLIKDRGSKEDKEFVKEKLRSALWLIRSVENRQRTIVKVAHAIVEKQQEFFFKGPAHLRPMILKDIADEIGMHESTVSRVTTNKYMHTPIGVFELKYFFNAGIGGKNGGVDISGEVLKIKIKELVSKENPSKPFSDQKLVEALKQYDIVVARRTVAKYREILGILPSAKRKQKK